MLWMPDGVFFLQIFEGPHPLHSKRLHSVAITNTLSAHARAHTHTRPVTLSEMRQSVKTLVKRAERLSVVGALRLLVHSAAKWLLRRVLTKLEMNKNKWLPVPE